MTRLPPGPSSRLLSTYRIMSDPIRAYAELQAKWGNEFTVPAMNGTVIATCSPSGAKTVFSTRAPDTRPFGVAALEPLVGRRSLLTLHGEEHFRERRLIMPTFHGPRMKAYGDAIQRIARRQIASWTPGQAVVVQEEMLEITFRVIIHAIFGVSEPERVQRYIDAITALVKTTKPAFLFFKFVQHPIIPAWTRFRQAIDHLDGLLYEDIQTARTRAASDDILSMLAHATYDDGTQMPDASIRDELVTLLFAGHETTSIALSLCVARLHRHPDAATWLQDALASVGESPEEVAKCAELTAFWKETLRLESIVPDVLRVLERDLEIEGYTVPKGLNVAVVIERIHRDPELYPEPEQFRPQRFIERRYSPHEYLPFGGGIRRCVGMALATYELELVLAELVRGPTLKVTSNDRMVRRNVVMGPSEGVRAIVQ